MLNIGSRAIRRVTKRQDELKMPLLCSSCIKGNVGVKVNTERSESTPGIGNVLSSICENPERTPYSSSELKLFNNLIPC